MKKIMIACALCAVAGTSAGYVGGKWFLPNNEAKQEEVAEKDSGSLPGRFTVAGNNRNSIPGGSSGQPLVLGDKSLDLLMKIRQGKMTPDQLKDEFQRIMEEMKGIEINSFLYYDQERHMLLQELARQWGLSAPHQALEELKKDQTGRGSMMRDTLIFAILNGWAERDPEAVAQYYMENREKLSGNGPFHYLGEWAKTDPQGAWRNLESLSRHEKESGVYSFFSSILETQPEKAAEYMSKLDKSQWENDGLLSNIVSQWSLSDKEGMDKWMAGLPSEQQDKLKAFTVMNMVEKSPEEAGRALSSLSAEDQQRALKEMGWKLGNNMNVKESMDWMSKYVTEDVVAKQAPQYIWQFESESSEGLYNWLKQLPEGKLRENVLDRYAHIEDSREVDYSARAGLLQTIKDDKKRDSALQNIFYRWSRKSPEESRKWLETASVGEQTKKNLMYYFNNTDSAGSAGKNTSLFKE